MNRALFDLLDRVLPRSAADFLRVVRMAAMHPCHIHVGLPSDIKRALDDDKDGQMLSDLCRGLDVTSLALLERLRARMAFFPDETDGYPFMVYGDAILTPDERREIRRWSVCRKLCGKQYRFPRHLLTPESFMYHHGLTELPASCHTRIAGRDFVDLGAFIGDSTLVLQKYHPRKTYAFDISPANSRRFWQTMRRNLISPERVELIRSGVAASAGRARFHDTGGGDAALGRGGTEVELTTVDAFAAQRALDVGLVKMDIEGAGLEALRGMATTLRTHRPVLLLAVYHNADEFLRIKPFIESLDLGYAFMLRKLIPGALFAETTLLCYPAELQDA